MRNSLLPVFIVCAFALSAREPVSITDASLLNTVWSGSPGRGADVLFIFLGYDDFVPDTVYACGDSYWNPEFEQSGPGWSLNSISSSWAEPSGSPYHWHGGLGSAMNTLGYSWEWFPGYTGRCGQVIPDASTLQDYNCIFILTFDAYRSIVLTAASRSILDTYMNSGGHVVFISQDAFYSGIPASWLQSWFDTGEIQQDVRAGTSPFPSNGLASSFMVGWAGTALIENFSTGAGGHAEGQWWADNLSGNGCMGDNNWVYSSYSDLWCNIFSTFDFETCSSAEVESISELIMGLTQGSALERTTWGAVKAGFD
jgi:hypothetical protein